MTDIDTPSGVRIMLEDEHRRRSKSAMGQLLHKLRSFIVAYTIEPEATLPDHALVWVTDARGDGPENVISDAILSYPELWVHALPNGAVVVQRKMLERVGLPSDVIKELIEHGACLVDDTASRSRNRLEQRERAAQG